MEELVQAVILYGMKDLEREEYRSDVEEFFNSEWFVTLATVGKFEDLGLDPASVRQQVNAGTYRREPIRFGYR